MASNHLPYTPSIVDRIISWVDRQRFPAWLYFLAIYLFYLFLSQGLAWLDQTAPVGVFELQKFQTNIWPALTLWIMYSLDKLALRASENFRPLMINNEEDYEFKVFQLTHMPARPVWILSLIGPLTVIISFVFDLGIITFSDRTILSLISQVIIFWVGFSLFPIFVFHTIRQLTIVSQIQSNLGEIDLFNATPLYSFSVLTSRTGIAWVLLLSTTLLWAFIYGINSTGLSPAFSIGFAVVEVTSAAASFVLPLVSLHTQMEKAKGRLIDEINLFIKSSISSMGSELKNLDPAKASAKHDLVETLKMQQEYVSKLPTWPWKTDTLRGFLSVLFLPILLMVIQQLVERLF